MSTYIGTHKVHDILHHASDYVEFIHVISYLSRRPGHPLSEISLFDLGFLETVRMDVFRRFAPLWKRSALSIG